MHYKNWTRNFENKIIVLIHMNMYLQSTEFYNIPGGLQLNELLHL